MRVAVLMGGPSSEHPVSLRTGAQVVAALGARALPVVISKDGQWSFAGETPVSAGRALDQLVSRADVVFVGLHGPFGEDGTVQGLLDAAGLPYVGSGVLGSALAMDKVRAKRVYRSSDIPTADFVVFEGRDSAERRAELVARAAGLGFPLVLKPAASGSSFGVSFPADAAALGRDVDALLGAVDVALAERRIVGIELSCGVLDHGDRLEALPVIEIVPDPSKYSYFDYEAKYTPGASEEIVPARIEDELARAVQHLAVEAHRVLGLRDYSRTDFMVDGARRPWVLESNTLPGLTAESLLPKAARVAGYEFERLIALLVERAAARGRPRWF